MKKGRKYRKAIGSLACIATFLALVAIRPAQAQHRTTERPKTPGSMIKESDVDYQLWESFVVMRKANDGEAPAQHELGLRYLMGKGFEADTQKAALWIKKAAAQDYVLAKYNLGILYHNGWGVDWNPFEAYRNFLHAAHKKLPDAEFVVGLMLTENLVVNRDWQKAYRYVKSAAEEGFEPARKALVEFQKRGIKTESDSGKPAERESRVRPVFLDFNVDTSSKADDRVLLKDFLREAGPGMRQALGISDTALIESGVEKSFERIERAADVGSPEALALLGRIHEQGIGTTKDPIKATAYYVRASRLESPRAYELLWDLIQQPGYREMLEKRAMASDAEAQFAWAGLVASRFDQLLSGDQAVKLLNGAANRNHAQSIIELGLCYQSGRWVQQDKVRAEELWKIAAGLGSSEARIRLIVSEIMKPNSKNPSAETLSYLTTVSEEGSILAQVALGYCHERGLGTPRNKEQAATLYRNAAQRGSESAYLALRRMHDEIRPKGKEFEIEE